MDHGVEGARLAGFGFGRIGFDAVIVDDAQDLTRVGLEFAWSTAATIEPLVDGATFVGRRICSEFEP